MVTKRRPRDLIFCFQIYFWTPYNSKMCEKRAYSNLELSCTDLCVSLFMLALRLPVMASSKQTSFKLYYHIRNFRWCDRMNTNTRKYRLLRNKLPIWKPGRHTKNVSTSKTFSLFSKNKIKKCGEKQHTNSYISSILFSILQICHFSP